MSSASVRSDAAAIFAAAIRAVDPTELVVRHLERDGTTLVVRGGSKIVCRWPLPITVVGAGKAAARMAAGCEAVLGADKVRGLAIVPEGCAAPLHRLALHEAGHPLPDARGEMAAGRVLDAVRTASNGVLCLISGGASSLMVRPRPPVTLQDKIETTQRLLDCGANIGEISTIRKHLSLVKGGWLLRRSRVPLTALILSDVPGDDPSTIGSGPSVPDPTTFGDAQNVLEKYRLLDRVPGTVRELLAHGGRGREQETVKPGDAEARRSGNMVIGSNRSALEGAAVEARRRGWEVELESDLLTGDTTIAARAFGRRLRQRWRTDGPQRPICVLAGGETTVEVRGSGRGGRNQEFALALVDPLNQLPMVVLSAGTDGIDGPTPAAGAFVDGATLGRAHQMSLDPDAALANNDSYTFFASLGDLLQCGPTGTNVMDIKIALLGDPLSGRAA